MFNFYRVLLSWFPVSGPVNRPLNEEHASPFCTDTHVTQRMTLTVSSIPICQGELAIPNIDSLNNFSWDALITISLNSCWFSYFTTNSSFLFSNILCWFSYSTISSSFLFSSNVRTKIATEVISIRRFIESLPGIRFADAYNPIREWMYYIFHIIW